MLPGIRFLFAAIVLSMSILIFGLGAAALLRAAHEEVSSVPTRRVMPEPVFAQQVEAPPPTLALLRVEPVVPEKTADAPAATAAPEPAPEAAPVPQVESDKLAALRLEDIAPAETTTPEITAKPEAAAAETTAPALAAAEPPASSETKTAALDAEASPPAAVPAPSEPTATSAVPDLDPASVVTKTAALGSPTAKVAKATDAKKADEKADPAELKKQKRAERAKERRRAAARRARLAAQQAAAQQAVDPFSQVVQQTPQPAPTQTTARRTRQ